MRLESKHIYYNIVGLKFKLFNDSLLGMVLSMAALVLLCTFFITLANSGTFVLSMLSSEGALNPPNGKTFGKIHQGIRRGICLNIVIRM